MSESVTIEWPEKDVQALMQQIERAMTYLNYDVPKAIGAAARSIIRSLGASTRIAPKRRTVREQVTVELSRQSLKTFDIEGWFGHPRTKTTVSVKARSLANAIKYHGVISRRGLARSSWRSLWDGISGAFGSGGSSGIDNTAADIAQIAKSVVSSTVTNAGMNSSILLVNKLDYIEAALEGGPKDIDTAMERAADGLMHSIDNQLVKRMGLGGLSR